MNSLLQLHRLVSRAMRTALPASAVTTAVAAICGRRDDGEPIAPVNAISHIVWGDTAAEQDDASIQYTAVGTVLNTMAVTSWSLVYEVFFGKLARKGNVATAVLGGVAVAGLAYVTDYHVVPKRLTPGFEKRLSPTSMLLVYSALAVSLPLVSLLEGHATSKGRRNQ
ncbi:MAG TPA: hypothetical protein VGN12_15270 [Pirellulales bacterium]